MEKRVWAKPEMQEFAFAANQYVAACGDNGRSYWFECDAGGGKSGELWDYNRQESFTDGRLHDELGNSRYDSYHACNDTHEASSQDEFVKGWFQTGRGSNSVWTEVYIWFENLHWWNQYDIHATTNLKIDEWETAKST